MERETNPPPVRLEIAWKTIIRVLAGILLAVVAVKLWPVFKLLIVSILLAVPLYRLVLWLCSKGWPRWAGLLVASLALVSAAVGLAAIIGPLAFKQASNFAKQFPKYREQLIAHVPSGQLRNTLERVSNFNNGANFQQLTEKAFVALTATLAGVLDVVLVMALTIYLMVDGRRALQWLVAFFPRDQQPRVTRGLQNIGDRVVSYVVGQSIVSGLFATYAGIVLSILHVPVAILLAILAGALDVIPVIGISVSLILAGTAALAVSTTTALLVVAFYAAYHVAENYFILPRVYGNKLRLSGLAVIVSMLAGGFLAGVVGAVAALPLVAAYPALEQLWLREELEPEVVKDHQEQLRAA
jgi:predicted PurR-regulated permease PerM